MKLKLLSLFLLVGLIHACSSDNGQLDEDDSPEEIILTAEEEAILGVWDLTTIDFDDSNAGLVTGLLVELLNDLLVEGNCEALVLTFNDDLTLDVERRDFADALGGDFTLTCPEESFVDITTWSLVDNELTIILEDETSNTLEIQVDGDTAVVGGMIVNVFEEVIPEEELGETTGVFTRRQ